MNEKEATMSITRTDLQSRRCQACESGLPPLTAAQVKDYLQALPDWSLTEDRRRIRRQWRVEDFQTALDFFRRVGEVAEEEGHHPDLHLTGYRNVVIELWTHALGGLTENDFIVAARIDALPVEVKV
jgi:4a-hydroxytetrahydrobiopterin dehydratase